MTIPECSKSRPDSNNATERMNAAAEQIYLSRAFFSSGFNYHKQFMDQYLPEGLIGEVGCGVAQASGYYNSPARQFVAFDLDVEIITAARDAYPRVLFIGADVSRLPVRDASLDAYIGLGIFELDGGGGSLAAAEASRVLKPAGLLYITVPYKNVIRRLNGRTKWLDLDVASYSIHELTTLIEQHGFEIVRMRPSSIAWGLGPILRRVAGLAKNLLVAENEKAISYRIFGPLLRPLGNSLLTIARKKSVKPDHEGQV